MTSLSEQQLLVPAQRTVFNLLRLKLVKIISILSNFITHYLIGGGNNFQVVVVVVGGGGGGGGKSSQ